MFASLRCLFAHSFAQGFFAWELVDSSPRHRPHITHLIAQQSTKMAKEAPPKTSSKCKRQTWWLVALICPPPSHFGGWFYSFFATRLYYCDSSISSIFDHHLHFLIRCHPPQPLRLIVIKHQILWHRRRRHRNRQSILLTHTQTPTKRKSVI